MSDRECVIKQHYQISTFDKNEYSQCNVTLYTLYYNRCLILYIKRPTILNGEQHAFLFNL